MLAANAVGLVVCLAVVHLWPSATPLSSVINYPNLVLVPVLMGFVAAWIWRPLNLGIGWTFSHSLTLTALGIGLAAMLFGEGRICILILSPLLFSGVLAGTLTGRVVFRRKTDELNALIAPGLCLLVIMEPGLRGAPISSVVTDEVVIAAPASKVWPHVLRFADIRERPDYWLFRLGLPYPVSTTSAGDFVGADRACVFSGGATFVERVSELQPERLLTFDILQMPRDPELIGHLDATRGQFELRNNGDGTTTLIGRTWYVLHVRPGWYFKWWTHAIFRAVHLRVMENVQRLAEGPI
jgi:hypothetical protein